MTTNMFNIKHAISSNSEILSLFHQFWSSAPLTNISTVYTCCVSIIGLCMYAAGCRNLIYKVLNLAVLSVFVVALWAYLTDITFIYVVYILTFVSAVVMLFLSVVLMLPSSAISVSTKGSGTILSVFTVPYFIETVLSSALFVGFFLCAYLVFAFYKARLYISSTDLHGEPNRTVKLEYADVPLPYKIKSLESNYTLKIFSNTAANNEAIQSCLSYTIGGTVVDNGVYTTGDHQARIYEDASLSKCILGVVGVNSYPVYVRVYPKYFFNSFTFLQDYFLIRGLLTAMYEFVDFYFKVLEPVHLLEGSKLYTKATKGLKKFVGIGASNHALPTEWYDQNGWRTQCRLYVKNERLIIFVLERPWWSPFQIFRTPNNLPIFRSSLQRVVATIQYYTSAIKDKFFIKNIVVLSLSHISRFLSLVRSMLLSVGFSFSSVNAELAAQMSMTLSIFLLAAPAGYPGTINKIYSSHAVGDVISESLENLAAIQHQLYVVSPLFMIVSVTGLLVALIGAPLFVSPGHATKKEVHKH